MFRISAHPRGPLGRSRLRAGSALTVAIVLGAALAPTFAHDVAEDAERHFQHVMIGAATRSTADYKIPQTALVRADGKTVQLADEINDGRPVVMDFIYTTCTSICPMSSQTLADLQRKLGARRDAVHLLSISIDPENDTPARLRGYAKKFGAASAWQYYTGTVAASTTVQQAFGVYRGDKMSHPPATLVRTAPGRSWVRLDGFATAEQLLSELRDSAATATGRHVQ